MSDEAEVKAAATSDRGVVHVPPGEAVGAVAFDRSGGRPGAATRSERFLGEGGRSV